MDKRKSYLAAPEHRLCYDGLVKSYELNKTLFSTYDKVYSLKRSQKDKDKDDDPSTGSDRGLKKRKTSKDTKPTKDSNMPQDQEENLSNDDEEPKGKTKAAQYDLPGIEDMVPNIWSPVKVAYDNMLFGVFLIGEINDIIKNIHMEYLPKRRWSTLEKKQVNIMIKAIDKQLKKRRMMRSLKKFIGGRHYGTDGYFNEQYDFIIFQNQRDLPKDISLVSVEVHMYDIKRSKSENKGKVPTVMELVLEQNQQDTSHEVSIRIEQYFLMTNYLLWEVILNGDSPAPTRVVDGVLQPVAPTTAKQRLARKNELKARGTLLMALPDKHQMKFNSHKDAKTLMKAIEKSLPSEWRTQTLIWRNKTDLEEQNLDDLFNSLKIYEAEVKSSSFASTTTQNITFVSSYNTNSTTGPVSAAASVSAVSTQIPLSPLPNVDSLSNVVIYLFFASQSNSPQLDNDDLKQIDADDLEEIDFKWQMAMKGHFARECRPPKDTRRNGATEPQRRNVPIETSTSNALVSQCDSVGSYDWSFQDEEEPTNYALMAFSSSSSSSNNELKDNALVNLRQNLEKAEQERDDLKLKLEKFQTSSKNLTKLLASQTNAKTGLGYNAQVFTRAMFDCDDYLSSGSDESFPPDPIYDRSFIQHVETSIPPVTPKPASLKPTSNGKHRNRKACFVCKSLDHLIKDYDYHEKKMAQTTSRNNAQRGTHKHYAQITLQNSQRHMVPATVLTQSKPVSITTVRPVSTVVPKIKVTRPRQPKPIVTKPNLLTIRHISPSPKASNSPPRVTAIQALVVNVAQASSKENLIIPFLVQGNPQHALKDNGVIDSGCSRHMTENMSYLSNFEELNGGYVTFGGNPKGGKIFGKGKIRTGKLDFDDVSFVKELQFNLFSISQMCDKKNSVLFTNTKCLVLSLEFKLPNESQVMLRVPRENNMYNVNLKNIVPFEDLTCLFAKAKINESNLWHRRLGHINFKTMNKLVKCNLVRGLPTKVFENDNRCVACKKGKQHRVSCKTKPVSFVDQPLYRLYIDLFGPTFVKSLNKKSHCLVVTDDYSRFTWVFFLATKDETSPILKTFIIVLKNQRSLKVKVIKSDNGIEFKNNDLNQFCGIKGIKREFSIPRTPQQNGIVERKNRTLTEAAKTMLADSLLPIPFWAEAVNTACYNGNNKKSLGRDLKEGIIILPPVSFEEHVAVQREIKAITLLLQSLPEDHMADFHHLDDAREIWLAMKARFGGNEESKKMRKTMLKQEFSEFSMSEEEGLHKGYDRALPPSWSQVALTLKTRGDIEYLSFDDLYNKLRSLEIDVKGGSSYGSRGTTVAPTHSAFIGAASTNTKMVYSDEPSYSSSITYTSAHSGSIIEDVLHSFVAENELTQQLAYKDFEQVDQMEMEELDIKWQMAMLLLRINRFQKKAGRKINFNNKDPARFDRRKERCYNCLQFRHFARECNVKKVDETARCSSFKISEVKTKEQKDMVSVDSMLNWNEHEAKNKTEEGEQVYGLMAGFKSDFADHAGNAVGSVYDAAVEFAMMGISPKLALEEKVRILSDNLENTTNILKYSKTLYDQAKIEKKKWEVKLVESLARFDKWKESSKNLAKLINISMSTRTKLGLGFKEYIRLDEVFDLSTPSVFNPEPENRDVESIYESDKSSVLENYDFASCVSSPKTNDSFSTVDVKILPKSDVKDPSPTNGFPSCSFKDNVKPPRNLYNFPSVVSKAASVPAGSRNSSASISAGRSIPGASRNRPASIHAGRHISVGRFNKLVPFPVGRSIPTGWTNHAARPFFRPTNLYFDNVSWPGIYDHMSMNEGRWGSAVKSSAGIVDSGCSRSMTGNKEKLDDFVLIKCGTVTFRGGDGKITGKGTIRTSKLNFKNVYYVEELQHFNLFYVSQICDKKNKVLFTDDECLVLTKEFQLPNESQ
nr:putative ribonuclease H-like domain-containing protein [Tanacetum cinerariifolium]